MIYGFSSNSNSRLVNFLFILSSTCLSPTLKIIPPIIAGLTISCKSIVASSVLFKRAIIFVFWSAVNEIADVTYAVFMFLWTLYASIKALAISANKPALFLAIIILIKALETVFIEVKI